MSRAPAGICLSLIAAATLALAGCGGDDSTSASATSPDTQDAVKTCLKKRGIDFTEAAPSSPGAVADLYIKEDTVHQVYVAFMESPAAAAHLQKDLSNFSELTGGTSGAKVVGDDIILARAKKTTDGEVARVEGCLPS